MSVATFSSGTTALTNALKQVFYIHKDVVAELKEKLDSITRENEELKEQKKTPEKVCSPCSSCRHLKELNKTLQENFNSRLKDKNAIIKHLEERLKNLSGSIDTQIDTERVLTSDAENSPLSKSFDIDSFKHDSCPDKDPVSPLQKSADSGSSTFGNKQPSKLKLPKEGQKRRRYVEQENLPGSKRQKASPTFSQTGNLEDENSQTIHDIRKRHRQLTKHGSDEIQKGSCSHSQNVLVPETENSTCVETNSKSKEAPQSFGKNMKDVTNEQRLNFLTIPETLVMDDFFSQEEEDDDEDDEYDEDTLKTVNKSNSLPVVTSTSSKSPHKTRPNFVSHEKTTDLGNVSQLEKCPVSSRSLHKDNLLNGSSDTVDKDNVLQTAASVLDSASVRNGAANDISLTSPLSPGIFDQLAPPLSNHDTPRSSKNTELDAADRNVKKFISCSTKPSKEIEKFLRSKSKIDQFDKSFLLRQTTLSQSFSYNNSKSNSKQGKRKSKNVGGGYDYDKQQEKEAEKEEAVLQEVIRQSLMEAEESGRQKTSCSSMSNDEKTITKSPFKVPLSPGNKMKKCPQGKVINDKQKYKSDQIVESREKSISRTTKGETIIIGEKSPKKTGSNCDNFKKDIVAATSPKQNLNASPEQQGLRRSPRLSLSTSPKFGDKSPRSTSSDVAKRALFLDNKNSTNNSSPSKKLVRHQSPSKTMASPYKACSGSTTSGKAGVESVKEKSKMSPQNFQLLQNWIADDTDEDGGGGREFGSCSQGLNASLDPDMRLSLYLDSEATLSTTQVPLKKATTTNNNNNNNSSSNTTNKGKKNNSSSCSSSQQNLRLDLDETVAPSNMASFSVAANDETTVENKLDKKYGERIGSRKLGLGRKTGRKSAKVCGSVNDSINIDDDNNDDVVRKGGSIYDSINIDDQDGSKDDDGDNNDDVEETIAPSPQQSPQQNSLRFHSQSMSGIPSTSRSFKFVTTVKKGDSTSSNSNAEEKATGGERESMLMTEEGDGDEGDCLDLTRDDEDDNYNVDPRDNNSLQQLESVSYRAGEVSQHPPVHSVSTLYDSFDVVPKKPSDFPHVQVVRKRSERDKLQGFSCKQCAEYYKDMNLSERELQQRMKDCSRHKEKYKAPSTPEHFWSLSIRDTAEDQADKLEKQPEIVRLRRRRRLEKKFKSKSEEGEDEEKA